MEVFKDVEKIDLTQEHEVSKKTCLRFTGKP
jgi:hypothetical protein